MEGITTAQRRGRASWADCTPVAIPPERLAQLETAWKRTERWNVRVPVAGELSRMGPEILDRVEFDLALQVTELLHPKRHTVLTSTGPQWMVRAWSAGAPPEEKDQHEQVFRREFPGTDWLSADSASYYQLVCRMSGLSIPLLPEEA